MLCPACQAANLGPAVVLALTICPQCLASVVVEPDAARRATAADTTLLDDTQLAALRMARKRAREARG